MEYIEESPLGRAEWIKVFGLLTGKLEEAIVAFDELEARYLKVKSSVPELSEDERPEVFTGSYWQGNWKAPSGKSLIATLIEDAGCRYVFRNHEESGNVELDFEVFFDLVYESDYFGKVTYSDVEVTRSGLVDNDERLLNLPALSPGHVFYCNATETDYFGAAMMEPDVVLRDLVQIFYPDEIQEFENQYFFALE